MQCCIGGYYTSLNVFMYMYPVFSTMALVTKNKSWSFISEKYQTIKQPTISMCLCVRTYCEVITFCEQTKTEIRLFDIESIYSNDAICIILESSSG